ncbi:MAG TPA: pantoate--beta-alanine ligase [Solirubrobacteraceae bacterium]|nr:pantoate--beta-alanine ligase [Solirubrobacteraceae bacterium]
MGRGADGRGADAVLLCVPDAEIAPAASHVAPGPLLGHCSGATGLGELTPHEGFSLHPLMTVTAEGAEFAGAGAAIAGTTPRALAFAAELAEALGMQAVEVAEPDRGAYHAAASIASNFLVTLEAAAGRVAAAAGVQREQLVPLVRATVDNWARLGPERALTGPVARGDEVTIVRQRAAVEDVAPDLTPLFDELVSATRAFAAARDPSGTDTRATGARDGYAGDGSAGDRPRPGGPAGMNVIGTVAELRAELLEPRRAGRRIGLVPTMGAFHEGHLSLMRRARRDCDVVVVSLFVNPAQFNDAGDLDAYPRDPDHDAALAAGVGVDYLFAPSVDEVYPSGFATEVSVAGVTEPLEGAHRGRAHFDGVTTVVTKLFNMVGPDVAYFGQKDAQQAAVIRRLVRDLDIPVAIEVCPTVREADGLAMSSRNMHLSPADRVRATALHRALRAAQDAVSAGERDPGAARERALAELTAVSIEPEYVELVSADTLAPVDRIAGDVLAVLAAVVGGTRLIDNQPIQPNGGTGRP